MALDGVMIDVPDTPENLQYYGKPEGGTRRPFPQTRTSGSPKPAPAPSSLSTRAPSTRANGNSPNR
jgi:hypothetical protein